MTDILKKLYNACDPYLPASAEYYYDCSEARGDSALAQVVQSHLALADDHICFLLSGHIGCGKSSELAKLQRALTEAQPPRACYFPVMIFVQNAYLHHEPADPARRRSESYQTNCQHLQLGNTRTSLGEACPSRPIFRSTDSQRRWRLSEDVGKPKHP